MEKREKEKCLRLSLLVVNPPLFVYPSLVEVDRSGIVFGFLFGRGDCDCIGYGPYPSSVEVDCGCIASVAL